VRGGASKWIRSRPRPPETTRIGSGPRSRPARITAPLVVAEGPPPRQPVAPWSELARELDADREDR